MIFDHEERANRLIQSFNVHGIFVAPHFPIKHVTAADVGSAHIVTLAGLLGNDATGKLVAAETYPQALQALRNIQTAIVAAAHQLGRTVRPEEALSFVTFTRADLADLTHVLELNQAYIDAGMPLTARAAMEVKKLPLGAAVEITATAVLPK